MTDASKELLPRPFCGDPMKRGRQLTMHVEPGDCLIGLLALPNEAIAAWNTRPQPTPSATGEIVERLQSWLDNEPNLSPAEAAQLADAIAAFKQQAATIAERDAENGRLRRMTSIASRTTSSF